MKTQVSAQVPGPTGVVVVVRDGWRVKPNVAEIFHEFVARKFKLKLNEKPNLGSQAIARAVERTPKSAPIWKAYPLTLKQQHWRYMVDRTSYLSASYEIRTIFVQGRQAQQARQFVSIASASGNKAQTPERISIEQVLKSPDYQRRHLLGLAEAVVQLQEQISQYMDLYRTHPSRVAALRRCLRTARCLEARLRRIR